MSFRLDWTHAIRDDQDLSSSAKLVAYALATYMDSDGLCWPSVATLAAATSLSQKTVKRARDGLVASGWLVVVQQGGGRDESGEGKPNRYRAASKKGVTVTPLRGSGAIKKGVTVSKEGGHGDPRTRKRTRKRTRSEPAAASSNGRASGSSFERARKFVLRVGREYPERALREELERFDLGDDDVEWLVAHAVESEEADR